jgi:AmmeMemoRadiSam system protein B/AmmeMemoRadiSam system protein A
MRWRTDRSLRPGGVREPAVAGMFYAGQAERLAAEVDGHVASARAAMSAAGIPAGPAQRQVAIVVPHAGHIYSGPTAGYAFAAVDAGSVRRVVLLGPAHYVAVPGIGVSSATAWRTPLGDVALDVRLAEELGADFDDVIPADDAHAPEHSLEVQLPFLQRVLEPGWQLLPLIVGADLPEEVAAVISRCADLPGTLVVVSTDLSHYLDHDAAVARDSRTIDAVLARSPDDIGSHDACGRNPLRGLLVAAARLDWAVELLDARNSGDTAGDWDRVVGYAAFLLTQPRRGADPGQEPQAQEDMAPDAAPDATPDGGLRGAAQDAASPLAAEPAGRIPPESRALLLGLARRTIEHALETGRRPPADPSGADPTLRQPGAAFVTLRSADGALLGCIGSLSARRALVDDVVEHAFDAAFRDPRFPPMTHERAEGMVIDISVLSPTRPFPCEGYEDLLVRVPVGSGVVVEAGRARATFLPAVWAELPEPGAFLAALWRKAGLAPGEWPDGTRIEVYDSEEFAEGGPAGVET